MQYVFLLILALLFVPIEVTCEVSSEAWFTVETSQSEEEREKRVVLAWQAAFAGAVL